MTNNDVILSIDEGTSGTRAALVGRDGLVSEQDYIPLDVTCPRPGIVEQDADVLLEKTLRVCRSAVERAKSQGKNIVALAIANQRCSAVLWDKSTGKSLAPVMVWQDSRHREEIATLSPHWDATLIQLAGRPAGVRSPYLWAKHKIREVPEIAQAFREKRLAFGTIDTWLLWHMSSSRELVTTPTNVTSGNAYVLKEHRYLNSWLDQLEFPQELLPQIAYSTQNHQLFQSKPNQQFQLKTASDSNAKSASHSNGSRHTHAV